MDVCNAGMGRGVQEKRGRRSVRDGNEEITERPRLAVMLALALPCHKHQQLSAENITDGQGSAGTLGEQAGQWCQTVVSAKPGFHTTFGGKGLRSPSACSSAVPPDPQLH